MDRAALDVALALELPCGGWCPRDRRAEDGPISARYPLCQTPSHDPAERTRWNVRDADATLALLRGGAGGGTALALDHARALGRPLQIIDLAAGIAAASSLPSVRDWLQRETIHVLNVAGPRESESPGIYREARAFLLGILDLHPPGEPSPRR